MRSAQLWKLKWIGARRNEDNPAFENFQARLFFADAKERLVKKQ